MKHIKKVIALCSENHVLYRAYHEYSTLFYTKTFLTHLDNVLNEIERVNKKAYEDFTTNKLKAADGKSFNFHALISSLCELCLINSFIAQSNNPASFSYEPKLRKDNSKNVEFSILINSVKYNVEVKCPNLSNYYEKLNEKLDKHHAVTRFDTRAFGKPSEKHEIGSPSMRVRDFMVDTNQKFPKSNIPNEINVLFIAWDDNNEQPCIELKHPMHGLLTPNSDFKDENGNVITFPNIDLIFVSDLYQNIIAHLSSGDEPLLNLISGVPYFERNARFPKHEINPFVLSFSRNLLIKPYIDIKNSHIENIIFNIPIAFSDQSVDVVDEKFVSKYATDIKISYK